MAKYIDNGITFPYVPTAGLEVEVTPIRLQGGYTISNNEITSKAGTTINAIDINWNGAQVGEGDEIELESTGELLKWIKDINNTKVDTSTLTNNYKIENGVITINGESITPITSHQSLEDYATKTWVENKGYLTQHQDISGKVNSSDLATVATSGNYSDLNGVPRFKSINGISIIGTGNIEIQSGGSGSSVKSDWNESDNTSDAYILNKPINIIRSGPYYCDTDSESEINGEELPPDEEDNSIFISTYYDNLTDTQGRVFTGRYNEKAELLWKYNSSMTMSSKLSEHINDVGFMPVVFSEPTTQFSGSKLYFNSNSNKVQEVKWNNGLKVVNELATLKGEKGDPGLDGKSAYEVAVANGFTGNVTEWLASLKGEKGDPGDSGNILITTNTPTLTAGSTTTLATINDTEIKVNVPNFVSTTNVVNNTDSDVYILTTSGTLYPYSSLNSVSSSDILGAAVVSAKHKFVVPATPLFKTLYPSGTVSGNVDNNRLFYLHDGNSPSSGNYYLFAYSKIYAKSANLFPTSSSDGEMNTTFLLSQLDYNYDGTVDYFDKMITENGYNSMGNSPSKYYRAYLGSIEEWNCIYNKFTEINNIIKKVNTNYALTTSYSYLTSTIFRYSSNILFATKNMNSGYVGYTPIDSNGGSPYACRFLFSFPLNLTI